MDIFDLIVVGGGISGSMAAISASRFGLKVLLIEKYGFLGGLLTNASVGPMMSFHAGDKQVIKGIPNELIERLKSRQQSYGHIYDTTTYTSTVTPFDYEGMKYELEQMALEAKVTILYHAYFLSADVKNRHIQSITVQTKGGIKTYFARAFIDASGDADLANASGVNVQIGREHDQANMPMTMNFRMANVDIFQVKEYIRTHLDEFPELNNDASRIDDAPCLSIGGFVKTFEEGQRKKIISFEREKILFFETPQKGVVIVNTTRVAGKNLFDPIEISEAESIGRKQVHEVVRFLKEYVAGFQKAYLLWSGPQIGIRSSRRIKGSFVLNEQDIVNQVYFLDVIAHGGYPIDVHPPEGHDKYVDWTKVKRHLPKGAYYDIPYRALLTREIDNLLAVGRIISCTFEALGAVRVSPIAAATGHAGGCAATEYIHSNASSFAALEYQKIQKRIQSQQGFIDKRKSLK